MSIFLFLVCRSSCEHLQETSHALTYANPDQRHTFAKHFEDGLNSFDAVMLSDILENMLAEDCVVDSSRLNCENNKGTEELESSVKGMKDVIDYFVGYMVAIPDMVFLVHEWRIFARANQQSCLVMKFSLSGTKIYDFCTDCNVQGATAGSSSDESSVTELSRADLKDSKYSVKFRIMSRTSKYENRKRKRISTMGEYVDLNQMKDHHVLELPAEVVAAASPSAAAAINTASLDDADTQCTDIEPTSSVDTYDAEEVLGILRVAPVVSMLSDAVKVNIVGIMRFHMNESNRVARIQCTHIHDV